jgi:gas vesicle protein
MGENPRDIQERIEDTREQMGETVEALAHKADVPGRIKGSVADKKDAITEKVAGAKDKITGGASNAHDSTGAVADQAKTKARQGVGIAKENPLGLAAGSLAAGFIVGILVPSTRVEDERIGPTADQVKDHAREIGSEAIEHGKDIAQDVAHTATQTAKDAGSHHADELRESVSQTTSTI